MRPAAAILLVLGCAEAPTNPSSIPPEIVSAALGTQNPLSLRIVIRASGTDSVRARYQASTAAAAGVQWLHVDDGGTVTLLGLRPATAYAITLDRGTDATRSWVMNVVTDDLPADLKAYRLAVTGTFTGYILTGLRSQNGGAYVVAFDSTGTVIWYRGFPEFPSDGIGEVKQQFNSNVTAFIGNTAGSQPTLGRYVEMAPSGEIMRTYGREAPFYVDNHELLLTPGPTGPMAHFFTYDLRPTDLTSIGGRPDALVAGHQLIRETADGRLDFFWNGWDHLELADWIEEPASLRQAARVDFDHPNSLTITPDGHYLVSMRHFGQVLKVDYTTGAVIWRLGGRRSDFQIRDDPLGLFSGQHAASILPNGNLLLYDNGLRHSPPQSRAAEYRLDVASRVATMVWEYRPAPAVFTPLIGFVERLASGNTFIAFANADHLVEVTPTKAVAWEATLTRNNAAVGNVYRYRRIPSLYQYLPP
jgi:Arylsulfotransferase (ASST)